eukprot:CAMPEP_0177491010 /NCGR_PEP_ID=MMETSP0369-20130122/31584_1 /TAXON_ID=447022 ORGANISM="Scrippsiella hangoei-like, Strain SHHI-4" /NCGR_SAMPLE_ID=MMETSP0369 /ASSEMBLY_ACC=CAM_ASM_000364 /LENGTH=53 /DNA_ID=CAMNT_0018967663 /DNA_START=344 /DNA_END=505 /DNA_ORIENTATION=+
MDMAVVTASVTLIMLTAPPSPPRRLIAEPGGEASCAARPQLRCLGLGMLLLPP